MGSNPTEDVGFHAQAKLLRYKLLFERFSQLNWPQITFAQAAKLIKPGWFTGWFTDTKWLQDGWSDNEFECKYLMIENFPEESDLTVQTIHSIMSPLPFDLLKRLKELRQAKIFHGVIAYGMKEKGILMGIIATELENYVIPYKTFYVGNYGFQK